VTRPTAIQLLTRLAGGVIAGQLLIGLLLAGLFWKTGISTSVASTVWVGLTAASIVGLLIWPRRGALPAALVVGLVLAVLVHSPTAQNAAESGVVHGGSGGKAVIGKAAGWVRDKIHHHSPHPSPHHGSGR
jgi:hypothetical protein